MNPILLKMGFYLYSRLEPAVEGRVLYLEGKIVYASQRLRNYLNIIPGRALGKM